MKCRQCGHSELEDFTIDSFHYTDSGLSRVYLQDVPARRCPACGTQTVRIRAIARLHRAIAEALIQKHSRFTGEEICFLRKHIGLSGQDFARRMGVKPETVSRWENDRKEIGSSADRLLRMLVRTMAQVDSYPVENLDDISESITPLDLSFTHGASWAQAS